MTLHLTRDDLGPSEAGDRYHRQSLIEWWDQARVRAARILVVGAGAIGNEVLKLLALTGVGQVLVYDPDRVERSNLSRTVLFTSSDEGAPKADVAARRMAELNPDVRVVARVENVVSRAGIGPFAWADVVIGAVDNREARVFINSACALAGRAWVDGAIESLSGVVRVFRPSGSAEDPCYECTMSAVDRRLIAERRSCALLARDVVARGHVPTPAVAASIGGAFEGQEAIKLIHGQPVLLGEGLHFHGLFGDVSRVRYPRREGCPGHEWHGPLQPLGCGSADITLGALLDRAEARLGPGAALDLSRDVVVRLECPECGRVERVGVALAAMHEADAACSACGAHRIVDAVASVGRDAGIDLGLTPAALGLPLWDVVVARAGTGRSEAWLFDGDAPDVLGPLAEEVP